MRGREGRESDAGTLTPTRTWKKRTRRDRKMGTSVAYKARQFNLSGLTGISDRTLDMHFKLYEGYVKETNILTEQISEFLKDGKSIRKRCQPTLN
jgi:hypothetical protein